MAKRVGVIDLGSNSARLAIFERTSRLGFYVMGEFKTKVRLGKGAYQNGGVLTDEAMDKCFVAFSQFREITKRYKVNKILCVGTSALRDAPNSGIFIKRVRKELGLNLRTIDGEKEAYYGAMAVSNLLCDLDEFVTIDIGGGSTELAKVKNGKIIGKISLNIGTVRLKELFFDKGDFKNLDKFTAELISQIPEEFKSQNLVTIGGSLRAIASAIMEKTAYPLKILHNFEYSLDEFTSYIMQIASSSITTLAKFPIKKDRHDTIREGAYIFLKVADYLGAKKAYVSGVGVREGVFLDNLLGTNAKFPNNFNPSLKSLQDRFCVGETKKLPKYAKAIFMALSPLHNIDEKFLPLLMDAAKVVNSGVAIDYYERHINSAYLAISTLNYGYTHAQKALISAIIRINGKKITDDVKEYKKLLPNDETLIWLSFVLKLAQQLDALNSDDLGFSYDNHTLFISGAKNDIIIKNEIKKMLKPGVFAINFI